jgi:5,10-methylenetetrahydrofolate reductase
VTPFELVCEVEPPTRPDLMHVRHQIGVMSRVASAFLIPDNHLGRATVSSIAVAHEVEAMGGRSIACLNGRDRNVLGLRRDLLTAVAYGVDQFLLVAGDRGPDDAGGIPVRRMLDEVRAFAASDVFERTPPFRLGVVSQLGALPSWKREADFVFVQVSFDVARLVEWRENVDFDGPVYAGVMVLASAAHATRIETAIPQIRIPTALHERLGSDPSAGVDAACELVAAIRGLEGFTGAHLVPVARYREVAARLERDLPHA